MASVWQLAFAKKLVNSEPRHATLEMSYLQGFEQEADAAANPNSCIWRVVLALTAILQHLNSFSFALAEA